MNKEYAFFLGLYHSGKNGTVYDEITGMFLKNQFEEVFSRETERSERDKLLTEVKYKDDEINKLKDIIARNEAENDSIIKKIDGILNSLETIQL